MTNNAIFLVEDAFDYYWQNFMAGALQPMLWPYELCPGLFFFF